MNGQVRGLLRECKRRQLTRLQTTMVMILYECNGFESALNAARTWPQGGDTRWKQVKRGHDCVTGLSRGTV